MNIHIIFEIIITENKLNQVHLPELQILLSTLLIPNPGFKAETKTLLYLKVTVLKYMMDTY